MQFLVYICANYLLHNIIFFLNVLHIVTKFSSAFLVYLCIYFLIRGKQWNVCANLEKDKHARDIKFLDNYAMERWEVRLKINLLLAIEFFLIVLSYVSILFLFQFVYTLITCYNAIRPNCVLFIFYFFLIIKETSLCISIITFYC